MNLKLISHRSKRLSESPTAFLAQNPSVLRNLTAANISATPLDLPPYMYARDSAVTLPDGSFLVPFPLDIQQETTALTYLEAYRGLANFSVPGVVEGGAGCGKGFEPRRVAAMTTALQAHGYVVRQSSVCIEGGNFAWATNKFGRTYAVVGENSVLLSMLALRQQNRLPNWDTQVLNAEVPEPFHRMARHEALLELIQTIEKLMRFFEAFKALCEPVYPIGLSETSLNLGLMLLERQAPDRAAFGRHEVPYLLKMRDEIKATYLYLLSFKEDTDFYRNMRIAIKNLYDEHTDLKTFLELPSKSDLQKNATHPHHSLHANLTLARNYPDLYIAQEQRAARLYADYQFTKDKMAQELGAPVLDVPQIYYHLDLYLAPRQAGTITLNSTHDTLVFVENLILKRIQGNRHAELAELAPYHHHLQKLHLHHQTAERAVRNILETAGFDVISTPGILPIPGNETVHINLQNSVTTLEEKPDGRRVLVWCTQHPGTRDFQAYFETVTRTRLTQSGFPYPVEFRYLDAQTSASLRDNNAGVHCETADDPNPPSPQPPAPKRRALNLSLRQPTLLELPQTQKKVTGC
ncbi:MAG: hypothetical protein AB7F28_03915 [Candidatus Margulisiibacteriota bacterium]